MLEMRTGTAIRRNRRPLIVQNLRFRAPGIHHRLDRQNHAFPQSRVRTTRAKIRHLRLFVQFGSNAVAYELAHHAETVGLDVFLHCRANIADAVADLHLLNRFVERFLGDLQQLLPFG